MAFACWFTGPPHTQAEPALPPCVAQPVCRPAAPDAYFATGIANSTPFAMLSGQRCMMLL
jgi:hypothetical protein